MATCDATSIAILTDAATDFTAAAAAADAIVTAQNAIVTTQQTIADNLGECIAQLRALNNPAYANSIQILVAEQATASAAAAAARTLAAQQTIVRDNATLNATQATAAAAALRPNATGATAGTPGSWTGGTEVPVNLAGTIAANITANPNTAWTTGQRVVTRDGSLIHWNGTAWTAGQAP